MIFELERLVCFKGDGIMKKIMALAILVLFQSCSRGPETDNPHPLNGPVNDSFSEWFSGLKPVSGEFPLHSDRPRLYLRPEDLELVRERTRTTHREEWKNIIAACKASIMSSRMSAPS